ncbi:uncharacterized protein LOC126899719 isoform X1 [Daktulosphaira vitifoliae]|uniref:uncharacterized protein LOC126899719 isoform X1 n=1 Tax=Daktulosphaira vitifoliae TaxID=58002 RepID=UPI0021AB096D|nr:uncharacterized protein LOC126899719 isoform X1 [Daktulosphaira vitifoliae]
MEPCVIFSGQKAQDFYQYSYVITAFLIIISKGSPTRKNSDESDSSKCTLHRTESEESGSSTLQRTESDESGGSKDDICPVCWKQDPQITLIDCNHKMCGICANQFVLRKLFECSLCRATIKSFSGLSMWKPYIKPGLSPDAEMAHIVNGVKSQLITDEELISRYFYLLPHQYADAEILSDIHQIRSSYSKHVLTYIRKSIKNDKPKDEIDQRTRRVFFLYHTNNQEKEILTKYFIRNGEDTEMQFSTRNRLLYN